MKRSGDDLIDVARALVLAVTQPHARERPLPNDLEGRFDRWFDGGAVEATTGGRAHFVFDDGTQAWLPSVLEELSPGSFRALVQFDDGRRFELRRLARPEDDAPN